MSPPLPVLFRWWEHWVPYGCSWFVTFQEKLDKFSTALYTFKFIVPAGQEMQLRQLFPMHTPGKTFGQGKYISLLIK